MRYRLLGLLVVCLSCNIIASAADYPNANAALSAGMTLLRNKQFAEAKEPLEAAFNRAALTDRAKRNAAEGLMVVYREVRESEKFLDIADFLINTADRKAGRSINSNAVAAFLQQNGMLDQGIKRYEDQLKQKGDSFAALGVLERIYSHTNRKDTTKAAAITEKLTAANVKWAKERAGQTQVKAENDEKTAAWSYLEAAQFWLEANDKPLAIAAAKSSQAAPPEKRTEILTYQWHQGLGDLFAETGETQRAITEYEAAIKSITNEVLTKSVKQKLDALRAKQK